MSNDELLVVYEWMEKLKSYFQSFLKEDEEIQGFGVQFDEMGVMEIVVYSNLSKESIENIESEGFSLLYHMGSEHIFQVLWG